MFYVLAYQIYDEWHDINNISHYFKEFNTLKNLRDYVKKYLDKNCCEIFICKVLPDIPIYRFKFYHRSKPYPYMKNVGNNSVLLSELLIDEYEIYKKNKEIKNANK